MKVGEFVVNRWRDRPVITINFQAKQWEVVLLIEKNNDFFAYTYWWFINLYKLCANSEQFLLRDSNRRWTLYAFQFSAASLKRPISFSNFTVFYSYIVMFKNQVGRTDFYSFGKFSDIFSLLSSSSRRKRSYSLSFQSQHENRPGLEFPRCFLVESAPSWYKCEILFVMS